MTPRRRKQRLLSAIILGTVGIILVDPHLRMTLGGLLNLATLRHVRDTVRSWGLWGPVLVITLMVLHSVVFVPAEIITVASIALFGPFWGVVYAWTGAMVAASVSFGLARLWGRPLVQRFVPAAMVQRLDAFFQREGTCGMLILRLIPLVSFNALNYAGGLTPMTWGRFLWTTGLGILPMEVLIALAEHSAHGKTDAVVGLTIISLALAAGLLVRTRLLKRYRLCAPAAEVKDAPDANDSGSLTPLPDKKGECP